MRLPVLRLLAILPLALVGCSDDPDDLADAGTPDAGFDAGPLPADGGLALGVTLDTQRVDLGVVVITSTDTATFTLTNDNGAPVRVTVTEPMGGDVTRFSRTFDVPDEGGVFEIPSGDSVTVTVAASPVVLGEIRTNLLVESCLGGCPVLVEVVAEGVESGLDCPDELEVPLVFPGECATRSLTCTNRSSVPEDVGDVRLRMGSDDAFTLEPLTFPTTVAPGADFTFDYTFCPRDTETVEARIRVATSAPFETEQDILLSGRGGGPLVTCGPTRIEYGEVGVGGASRGAYTCYNDGFDPAGVRLSLADGADFRLATETASIPAGRSQVFRVIAAPTAAGAAQDRLTVTTDDAANPSFEADLSATGVTIGTCGVEAVPAVLDFGVVDAGSRHSAPILVVNTSMEDCLVSGAFVTSGAEQFSVVAPRLGARLAPGETTRVEVVFTPRISAIFAGEVEITFANPGNPNATIEVRGQGGPAGVIPEPLAVDFGDVPTTCAAPVTRTITLRRLSGTATGVNNVVVEGEGFTLETEFSPTQLGFYETLTLEIGFAPTLAGAYTGEVRVFFGLPSPVRIPLSGVGRPTAERTDRLAIDAPKVDLLFVVDDSGGNTQVQANLAAAMPAFAARLAERQADFHFAVVTTDMEAPNRSGRIIGMPAVLDSATVDVGAAMAERVMPGTEGAGIEMGLAASFAALSPPLIGQDNAGFRRPDADLAIVYVSSEDDQSSTQLSSQVLLQQLRRVSRGQRLLLTALVGPPSGECDGPSGSAVEAPRYATVLGRHDDALLLDYCAEASENLDAFLDRLLGANVALTGVPVIDQLMVRVGGMALPATDGATRNWGYDLAANEIVFFDAEIATGDAVEVTYPQVCVPGTCGDETTDAGEFCDDGNATDTDACIECRNATCGDGITWSGVEDCDDGNLRDDDACLTSCVAARCGDGIVQVGVEVCDDGNTVGGDACPATCRFYQTDGVTPRPYEPLQNPSPLTFSDNDDGRTSVQLPFTFDFGGVATTSIAVSVNGFASVLSIDPAQSFDNTAIPDLAAPNGILAPWWDDLVLDDTFPGGAATSTATLGVAPNRQYVIEWRDLRSAAHSSNNHRRWTFQLVLEETTQVVRFRYADTETRGRVPTAVTASGGLEAVDGALGIEGLGCTPNCQGPQRQGNRPDGFPEQSEVVFTP